MIRNDATTWGWPAKALHWIGAAVILVLLVHGWWMTHLAPRPERLANYAWHAALGYDLRSVHALFEESHTWLSDLLALIVLIHILAALRHHFVKRNDVFRRMVR